MKITVKRTIAATVTTMSAMTMLGACATHEPRTVPAATVPIAVPAASPATTTIVVPPANTPTRVTYSEGAYELRGQGSANNPYYWVWVPNGVQPPALPPPPPLPPAR